VELVLLSDFQKSYASDWMRVANTSGLGDVHIGDRFREQGFGAGAEELEVDGLQISDVGGLSRLHVIRAANATQPETHRLGAVFLQVGIKPAAVDPAYQPLREIMNGTDAVGMTATNGGEPMPDIEGPTENTEAEPIDPYSLGMEAPIEPVKRGRGRPPGSKNKKTEEIKLPVGFA
jgi:hypothetical protein